MTLRLVTERVRLSRRLAWMLSGGARLTPTMPSMLTVQMKNVHSPLMLAVVAETD